MSRCHLYRPIVDAQGNLAYGAQVTIRQANLNLPTTQTLYSGPRDDAGVIPNPFIADNGYINLWMDEPERINILVEQDGMPSIQGYFDVYAPANEVVRSDFPLEIVNSPSKPGQTMVAINANQASWQDAPIQPPTGTVPPHQHPGVGANSVAVGTGANASGSQSTVIGNGALAVGINTIAFGFNAQAQASDSSALGASSYASGSDSTAVGYLATSSGQNSTAVGSQSGSTGNGSVAVGSNTVADGDNAASIGQGASASGLDSVAIGRTASASGTRSIALGSGASASYTNSVAIGPGVSTSADGQIALGDASSAVAIQGALSVANDASLGVQSSQVGFYGAAPVARQVVTGSDGGNTVLRALLIQLDQMGLIINNSTQG